MEEKQEKKEVKKETTKKETKKETKPEVKKETKKVVKKEVKKEILPRTAVKGLINGFIAYGILLIFIFLSIVVVVTWFVENNKDMIDYNVLKYSLPTLAAFLIFFLVRSTCRLSTFDLFKNCKIKKDEIDSVCSKMNFFYICVVIFSVLAIIVFLIARFGREKVDMARDLTNYSQSNSYYAREKEEEIMKDFEERRSDTIIQTMIIEAGLLLGMFSLIPNQKKLIELYN